MEQHCMRQISVEDNKDSYDYASTSMIVLEPIISDYEPPIYILPSTQIARPEIFNDQQSLRSSSEKSFSEYYINQSLHMVKPVKGEITQEGEIFEC